MWTNLRILCLSAALGLSASPNIASAETDAQTLLSTATDVLFDWEVLAAPYVDRWYVIVEWNNGSVSEYRHTTEESAENWMAWLYFHIVEVEHIEIEYRREPGEYVSFGRFDRHADAADLADLLESVGLAVQIKTISVLFYTRTTTLELGKSTMYPQLSR
jgi:hypothetical protein